MDKKVLITFAILQTIVAVNSLQCYECFDCATVTSEQLVECPLPSNDTTVAPTTAATTTLASTTATPNNNNTTNSTVNPDPNNNNTTNSTVNPNPNNNNTTNSTINPNINTNNTTNSTVNPNPNNNSTTNSTGTTPLKRKRESNVNIFEKLSTYRLRAASAVHCVKATVKYNDTYNVVIRGCATPNDQGQTVCDNAPTSVEVKECRTCESDKCNNAFATQPFLFLILLPFIVRF